MIVSSILVSYKLAPYSHAKLKDLRENTIFIT